MPILLVLSHKHCELLFVFKPCISLLQSGTIFPKVQVAQGHAGFVKSAVGAESALRDSAVAARAFDAIS